MITFDNGGRLVQDVAELPNLAGASEVYLDFETTSGDRSLSATNPWHHCWAAGFAITVDEVPGAWYVPLAHSIEETNLPRESVLPWLRDTLEGVKRWHNHNVKFDCHVLMNDLGIDVLDKTELVCSLTSAKILRSDRSPANGYRLDYLSRDWLHEHIEKYEQAIKPYTSGCKNKDYGLVPADVMAEYACQDVITNRRLSRHIAANMPESCKRIWEIETAITTILAEMERVGMPVNTLELQQKELIISVTLLQLEEKLEKLVGRPFRPHVNEDCFDILCNHYGLPILAWTEEDEDGNPGGNPSFDKNALKAYAARPDAPREVVKMMQLYRHLNTFLSNFVRKYQIHQVDGRMHSSYNQLVRTGRLSCKEPNAQQLSPQAKELVHPPKGMCFISADASQIEFRLIAHYIQDHDVIRAYNEDPDVDFHNWVAEQCEVKRKSGKTLNFSMGYGAGKRKVLGQLAANEDIIEDVYLAVEQLITEGKVEDRDRVAVFESICRQKAITAYDTYHAKLPNLKRTTRAAERVARTKGYVQTVMGRRRHLPENRCHIAFNTVNQGSAADIIKERMIAVREELRGTGIQMMAQVHDELVFIAPAELAHDPDLQRRILGVLEQPEAQLRVPLRWTWGASQKHWWEASDSAELVQLAKTAL